MHKIGFAQSAAKILEKVYASDRKLYSRLITAIKSLANNPYQGKALKGRFSGDYSLRVGDYRVIYTVYKERLVVYIIDLGHRKEIYR